jgi:hypothetical protein
MPRRGVAPPKMKMALIDSKAYFRINFNGIEKLSKD